MTFKTSFVALAVFAALTQSAIAQEKSDTEINKNKEIERITVTASRMDKSPSSIPNTVTIIDRVQLEEQFRTTKDLSTIIGNLAPSFSPSRQKMSNTGETLRGRAPLIMIDGVPQSNPLRSGTSLALMSQSLTHSSLTVSVLVPAMRFQASQN